MFTVNLNYITILIIKFQSLISTKIPPTYQSKFKLTQIITRINLSDVNNKKINWNDEYQLFWSENNKYMKDILKILKNIKRELRNFKRKPAMQEIRQNWQLVKFHPGFNDKRFDHSTVGFFFWLNMAIAALAKNFSHEFGSTSSLNYCD